MFFFAEAMFGTEDSNSKNENDSPFLSEPRKIGYQMGLSISAGILAGARGPLRLRVCALPSGDLGRVPVPQQRPRHPAVRLPRVPDIRCSRELQGPPPGVSALASAGWA
jgi:hypothetical protein